MQKTQITGVLQQAIVLTCIALVLFVYSAVRHRTQAGG